MDGAAAAPQRVEKRVSDTEGRKRLLTRPRQRHPPPCCLPPPRSLCRLDNWFGSHAWRPRRRTCSRHDAYPSYQSRRNCLTISPQHNMHPPHSSTCRHKKTYHTLISRAVCLASSPPAPATSSCTRLITTPAEMSRYVTVRARTPSTMPRMTRPTMVAGAGGGAEGREGSPAGIVEPAKSDAAAGGPSIARPSHAGSATAEVCGGSDGGGRGHQRKSGMSGRTDQDRRPRPPMGACRGHARGGRRSDRPHPQPTWAKMK